MNWEYFILFAIAALVCWALGAFAAWKGTKPGWAYGFTFLGLAIFSCKHARPSLLHAHFCLREHYITFLRSGKSL